MGHRWFCVLWEASFKNQVMGKWGIGGFVFCGGTFNLESFLSFEKLSFLNYHELFFAECLTDESFISSRDYCQRSSPSHSFDTLRENLNLRRSCVWTLLVEVML